MNINVRDAIVRTAAVEIRSLSISGKQVTLAVFRQLLTEPALAYDDHGRATAKGPIWGMVNYHPDRQCKTAEPHIHVVWQRGDELRRSVVEPGRLRRMPERVGDAEWLEGVGLDWLAAASRDGWRPSKGSVKTGPYGDSHVQVAFTSGVLHIDLPREYVAAWQAERNWEEAGCWTRYKHSGGRTCDCEPPVLPDPRASQDDARDAVEKAIRATQAAREANADLATALEALPQLFIAV
jgi:hypothetical protein